MTTAEKPKYRSVSQFNQYKRCPHAYYLDRIERAWKRPAAWLPQGSAVHATLEWWERGGRKGSLEEAKDVFRAEYQKEVAGYCEITPNFEWWFKSGPYDGLRDVERRHGIGLEQVGKYLLWANSHPDEVVWVAPDGTPGIELKFDIALDGIPVTGFIDLITEVEVEPGVWELRVRDHKTGNKPGDDFQLGVYSVAVAEEFGVHAPSGDYWMGRSGKPTYPFDLTDWTKDRVTEAFRELDDNIRAERFDPLPDPDKCGFCDVASACRYAVG